MFISHFKSLSGKAHHQGLLTHDQERQLHDMARSFWLREDDSSPHDRRTRGS